MAAPQPVDSPIRLAPDEWRRATWRRLPPLPLPASPGFDTESGLKRLALAPSFSWQGRWSLPRCKIPVLPSSEEASFWLKAISELGNTNDAARTVRCIQKAVPRVFDAEDVPRMLRKVENRLPEETWSILLRFGAPQQAVNWLLEWQSVASVGQKPWELYYIRLSALNLGAGFHRLVLPYLSQQERGQILDSLNAEAADPAWETQPEQAPPLEVLLCAALGGAAIAPIVQGWPDRTRTGAPPLHPQAAELILGLGSAAEVQHHATRLRFRLDNPTDARAWLAHTELAGMDLLLDSVLAQRRKPAAEALSRVLTLAETPIAAPYLLKVMLTSHAPGVGRNWLDTHPEFAATGLIETAQGRGQLAEAAREVMQSLRRAGHADVVDQALASGDNVGKLQATLADTKEGAPPTLEETATPDWLRAATVKPAQPRRPNWLPPGELPPITLNGKSLTPAQEEAILSALQQSTLKQPQPLLAQLKQEADRHTLDAFVWWLCKLWQQRGRKAKEAWALEAVGLLGGDDAALKLGPLAKEWREKLQHRIAATAIECLAAIGTDTALSQLRKFTLIPRDWSLKETADIHLKAAAKARGLTDEELEDRLVPDCGLGEGGVRTFDFGPRQFRLVLGQGLKPMLRDPDGKLRSDLPKPNAKDDAALAERSTAEWKLLKKLLADVLKTQARRLEQAMIHGRQWSASEFEAVFLRQPVMSLLGRTLVWAAHAPDGARLATFRVAEDNTPADVADALYELRPDALVSIPHPLLLTEEERAAWGEQFADYDLAPPFPQLGREIIRPTDTELGADRLTRFNHLSCMAVALSEGLERLGWRRGDVGDGGCYYGHLRQFPAAKLRAAVEYEPGIFIGSPWESPEQHLDGCSFYEEGREPSKRLLLGNVDPIVFSETVASLADAVGRR